MIEAKLHYYQTCVFVLHGTMEFGGLQNRGQTISLLLKSPPDVAHARSTFNGVKEPLRNRAVFAMVFLYPAQLLIMQNGAEIFFRINNATDK